MINLNFLLLLLLYLFLNQLKALVLTFQFCIETVVTEKDIKIYPNSKEYITPNINNCIKKKKKTFQNIDVIMRKTEFVLLKELKVKLRETMEQHRQWVKEEFADKDTKDMLVCVKDFTNLNMF